MITFKEYISEATNCPEGKKYCNKCQSCVDKTCEEKAMKEGADKSMENRQQQIQRKQLMINRQKLQLQMKAVSKKKPTDMTMRTEGAAWTKKEGQNKEGGLNEKGRKSYEKENPGSDLKAPSKKVGNPRRRSFCARMKGMRKRQKPSNNTGDDRLSKSLRAWNC
tara:strand:- start:419 stop:910 length:492 start_codon:yes stop_codon:yes gene_type:complete